MREAQPIKQIFIISEGGKLVYHKDFIGLGVSPEIIAGFLSAFSSFFKEAFKSEPRELLISDSKIFFNTLGDNTISVVLTQINTKINDLKPLFKILVNEVERNLKSVKLNFIDKCDIEKKLEYAVINALNKYRRENQVKIIPLTREMLGFILSKIRNGLPSFIRTINLGGKIVVLGEEGEVKKVTAILKSILSYSNPYLKTVEYSFKFQEADIIGLPFTEKNSIPQDYFILDLSTGNFTPEIKVGYYSKLVKDLGTHLDEKDLKRLLSYFIKLPRLKKEFLTCIKNGDVLKADKIIGEYTNEEKEMFFDHIFSNDSVLKTLREYSRFLPIDILKSFNSNLIVFNNKLFYKNELSVDESLKLINEIHFKALDFLSARKVKQLQESLKKNIF